MSLRLRLAVWQYRGMRVAIILILCLCFFPGSSLAAETTVTDANHVAELWEGRALTARFRVGMCYNKQGKAWGVLLLRHARGQEDVYHLYGTMRNNQFDLHHSSGHYLSGTVNDNGTMRGKAKLGNGMKLSLSGTRKVNVPLRAEDCAPMN